MGQTCIAYTVVGTHYGLLVSLQNVPKAPSVDQSGGEACSLKSSLSYNTAVARGSALFDLEQGITARLQLFNARRLP